MANGISLIDPSHPDDLEALWRIYENSFPESERRDRSGFDLTINQDNYRLKAIKKSDASNELVGLLGYWMLDEQPVIFLEHLAVAEAYRNQKIGEAAVEGWLEEIKNKHPEAMVVLEADKASAADPMAERRLNFYGRVGFSANPHHAYIQPSYGPGLPTVPMELLSVKPGAPDSTGLTREEFERARHLIHTGPYGLEHPVSEL